MLQKFRDVGLVGHFEHGDSLNGHSGDGGVKAAASVMSS